MLSELLGVVSASVPRQDEAAPTNQHTKVPDPPVQSGLHPSFQLFPLSNPLRENERCGSLTSHGSASKTVERTAKVPNSSPFGQSSFRRRGKPGGAVKPRGTWFP